MRIPDANVGHEEMNQISMGVEGPRSTVPRDYLVSVILPTRNRAHLIPRAIDSVLGQTVDDFELIVIDNGSADSTPAVLANYAKSDPRVFVARSDSARGAAAARNVGIQHASGAYVAFIDDDDAWLPTKLDRQLSAITEAPNVGVVFCPYEYVSGNGRKRVVGMPPVPEFSLRRNLLRGNFLGTACILADREVLLAHGGFDERLQIMEDWDLWCRLAAAAEFVMVPEPLVVCHHTSGSLSRSGEYTLASAQRFLGNIEMHGTLDRGELADLLNTLGHMLMLDGITREGRRWLFQSVRFRPWPPRQVARVLASGLGHTTYLALNRLSEAIQRLTARSSRIVGLRE